MPIWGRAVCSDSRPAPLKSAGEETHRDYPNVSDPRYTVFSWTCFSQKTKAPARNGDPRDMTFFWACFSHTVFRKLKPLLRTPTRGTYLFSAHVFLRKQEPLLGTPIRDGSPFPGHALLLGKQEPLRGTATRET